MLQVILKIVYQAFKSTHNLSYRPVDMEQRMSLERYILTDAEESMIPSTSNDHTSEITHLACTPSSLYESFRDQNEIKNFLKEPISPAKTDSSVQPLAEWTDDYSLVEATLKAEATGTQTPLIREEIRYSIQRKRRLSGLDELRPEYKVDKDEQVRAISNLYLYFL